MKEEPPNIHVTGFRDPFLAPWPAMDVIRNQKRAEQDEPGLYGLVSGGVHDQGPRIFLYQISRTDLSTWNYIGSLVDNVPVNSRAHRKWCADLGVNWECANFVNLGSEGSDTLPARDGGKDDDHRQLFVIVGSEGSLPRDRDVHVERQAGQDESPQRVTRYAHWLAGDLVPSATSSGGTEDGDGARKVEMQITSSGLLDAGLAYAAATQVLEQDGRTLCWTWLIEEDVSERVREAKGRTGCLGIPRELFLWKRDHVIGGYKSPLSSIGNLLVVQGSLTNPTPDDGNADAAVEPSLVKCLGQRPLRELESLRGDVLVNVGPSALVSESEPRSFRRIGELPLACELELVISIQPSGCEAIELQIRQSEDHQIQTCVTVSLNDELIIVDREHSTRAPTRHVNRCSERGDFTLFRLYDRTSEGQETRMENLHMRIFLDHDVLEVFANDRFALSTRIYSPSTARGCSVGAFGAQGSATLQSLKVWSMRSIGLR